MKVHHYNIGLPVGVDLDCSSGRPDSPNFEPLLFEISRVRVEDWNFVVDEKNFYLARFPVYHKHSDPSAVFTIL